SHGRDFSNASELWSFGMIVYEMCFGKLPFPSKKFKGVAELSRYVNTCWRLNDEPRFAQLSVNLQHLLSCLLELKPAERLNWTQLFNHPFLQIDNNNNKTIIPVEESI